MNGRVLAGVSGALCLAVLALSTASGQAQTQTQLQSASPSQGQLQTSNSVSQGISSSGSLADASNASQNNGSQNIIFNSPAAPTNTTATIKTVPNVYAPGLAAAGSEVCLGSMSAGGSGQGFGLTIGGTYVDRECQLRLNARTLAVLGYPVAARETMCLDPDVRQAMAAAGTPCVADSRVPYYAPNVISRRAEVTDPRNSTAAVAPQIQPQQTIASASTPGLQPGCHKEFQLFRGWVIACDDAQSAALQRAAEADPAQYEPQNETPVQQANRQPSTGAKPAQAHQRKSVAAAKPVQADQQKSAAAKPVQADPWKPMDAAEPNQAGQRKPVAAAGPMQADPRKSAAAKPVQADPQRSMASAEPVQADPQRSMASAEPVQADARKSKAAAKPVQADPRKSTAAAKPVQADLRKATAAKPVQAAMAAAEPVQMISASDSTPDPTSELEPGCHKEYSLIGGWRTECSK